MQNGALVLVHQNGALVLVHHSPDLGMTEIGLIQQYSSQQPMAESVIRFVTFT